MTSLTAGGATVLISQWYAFDGGPLANLDAPPTIAITEIADATAQSTGSPSVVHVSTGTYSWLWNTVPTLDAGAYLVEWAGTYLGAPVSASETVTVLPALAGAYATVTDWANYGAGTPPDNAALLLRRASRQIDAVLLSAVYDVADVDVIAALRDATIEQALYGIEQGWENGVPGGYASVTIGSVKLDRGTGGGVADRGGVPELGSQAFTILQLAGLTGHAPWTG